MSENIQAGITKEFANLFTSLSSRVDVFQTTQKDFLESFIPQIKEVLPHLKGDDVEISAAIYGICLTDDALKAYSITQFAEDIKYLHSLAEEDAPSLVEQLKKIEEEEANVSPGEAAKAKALSEEVERTWSDRAKDAISSESQFMKILTAYYQANLAIETALNNFNNDIILHQMNYRPEVVITSLLIRQHLLPLYDKIVNIYETAGINVDLRFVTAQVYIAYERIIDPNKETISQAKRYGMISEVYPLSHGSDLYWDLSEQILYPEFYERIKELLGPQIAEAIREKELATQTMKNKLEQLKVQQPGVPTTESIRSKVDSLIFETIQFGRAFDDNARTKMNRAVESVLKRMALDEFGVQDIPDLSKFIDYFNNEFFQPIFDEYRAMYLPFIDIRDYRAFVNDPEGVIEKSRAYILNQFWFNMRRHTRTDKPSASQLAHAFSMVMYDILNDKRVIDFDK